MASEEQQPVTTYHPELQDEIWDGVISIDLYQPIGQKWRAFTQAVIDRSHDSIWASYIQQPPNTSSILDFAGSMNCYFLHLMFNIILNTICNSNTVTEPGDFITTWFIQKFECEMSGFFHGFFWTVSFVFWVIST